MSFEEIEDLNGVRMAWNGLPSTRVEATKAVIPPSVLYTPLKSYTNMGLLQYQPVVCKCGVVLNPYCQIDVRSKLWICPLCLSRNGFPPHYHDNLSTASLPHELLPQNSTIEYSLSNNVTAPPVFMYVVDTCLIEEDLKALKDALIVSLSLLPPNAHIGLITFGRMAQVYELGYSECPKSYVFRGDKQYSTAQIQEMLGLSATVKPGQQQSPHPFIPGIGGLPMSAPARVYAPNKYVLPVSQCEFTLTSVLEQLQRDPWPTKPGHRSDRCSGAALGIAAGIMETAYAGTGGRIILFSGGAATIGPGTIVGNELREAIRSHHDIENDTAKHTSKAIKYYESVAKRCSGNGHAVDIFVGSLDQIGLHEMKMLSNFTSGHIVLSDSFTSVIFKESFHRLFNKDAEDNLLTAFNAVLDVQCSKELRVCGLIGHGTPLADRKSASVSDTEIGLGGTTSWRFCVLSPKTTAGIYFEVANTQPNALPPGSRAVIQFKTLYQHSSGVVRLRVTTIARNWAEPGSPELKGGFDQEAAAVLMARITSYKGEIDDGADVLRWLDRMLIRLCARFADYRKGDPASFHLAPNFGFYPQFMFHLRRSQFLQVFNNSPDETAFYRHTLLAEDTINSLVMIQPTLTSFEIDKPAEPVLLDSVSIAPDRILLLDTFFHIVIWHGSTIAAWRESGYHLQEGYENLKQLLDEPIEEAQQLLLDRFPIPRYVVTDQGGSQERFLIHKLNPSATHTTGDGYGAGAVIFTEDVNLQVFMEHLIKLTVSETQ
ncbi:protein transport protein SEC23 [Ramicandelaber brevisporus]|nr:protein transport protein SEC23 [Ramicandelaber brevisporus]